MPHMPKVEKTEQGKSRFTGKDEAVARRPERDDIRNPTMWARLTEPNSSHGITTVVIKCEKRERSPGSGPLVYVKLIFPV